MIQERGISPEAMALMSACQVEYFLDNHSPVVKKEEPVNVETQFKKEVTRQVR